MNDLKIYSIFIFCFIIAIALNTALVEKKFARKTEKALADYSMLADEMQVTDKVILGRGKDRLRPGAISLICIDKKDVSLLVQDSRSIGQPGASGSGQGILEVSNLSGDRESKVELKNMSFLSRGYFYTYMSEPFSIEEKALVLAALKIEDPDRIDIYTSDGKDFFTSRFNILEVNKLIDGCAS